MITNQTDEIESRTLDETDFGMVNDMDNVILEDIRRKHVIGGTKEFLLQYQDLTHYN